MKSHCNIRFITETPDMYNSPEMQDFIAAEVKRPNKQWVNSVIAGRQESEFVKLRNKDYVILPDTEKMFLACQHSHHADADNRRNQPQWEIQTRKGILKPCHRPRGSASWLVIFTDPALKTLRDLEQSHVDILRSMLVDTYSLAWKEYDASPEEVLTYFHYHPTVYRLHVHVIIRPSSMFPTRDVLRMHPVPEVISNICMDSEFYAKASLTVGVSKASALYSVLAADPYPRFVRAAFWDGEEICC